MRIANMTSPEVAESLGDPTTTLAIPLGAVEQHGAHLPLEVDAFLAEAVVLEAANRIRHKARVLVAPPVAYGCSEYHMGFPGTFSIGLVEYIDFVAGLLGSAQAHGFKRVALINGHGGNIGPLGVAARRFGHAPILVAVASYWDFAAEAIASLRRSGPGGISHSGELETSLMLHLKPEHVRMDRAVDFDAPTEPPWTSEDLLAPGIVAIPGDVDAVTPSGVIGRPSLATPEFGEAVFSAAADNLAEFLEFFATQHPSELSDAHIQEASS